MRFLLLGLALAGCAAGVRSEHAADERDPFGLPVVRAPLVFPPGAREVTLAWMLDELARSTGQELAMDSALRERLAREVEPLEHTTPVPADEVYAYVEAMLATRSVFVAPVKAGASPVLGVYGRREDVDAARAVTVEPGDVLALQDHPALLCQLTLTFASIDSLQMQTVLRWMLVEGFQSSVPAGEHGLVVRATGAQVLALARLLTEADRVAAR